MPSYCFVSLNDIDYKRNIELINIFKNVKSALIDFYLNTKLFVFF